MKTKKLLEAVEGGTQTAVEYLTPYVAQALREGGGLADQTYSRIRPALNDARIRGARFASDTFERVHPVLDDALDRVSPAVSATVKKVKPAVDDVLQRIPPTVDHARGLVQDDYLPKVADLLRHLASEPLAKELKLAAASAALAKQLDHASGRKKRSGWRTFGKLLLAGAALGGAFVALRKLLADPSTGWETHTPKTAYVADPADVKDTTDEVVDDVEPTAADLAEDVKDAAAGAAVAAGDVAVDVSEKVEDVADQASDKVAESREDIEDQLDRLADEAEGGDASPLAVSPYGAGSFVGSEPPEGFTIKGNDRSMKYHLPGSAAYDRTIAAVWFTSEEAAQEAGFVRAQR